MFAAGGARVSDHFGIAFDLLQENADLKIQRRAQDLAGAVTDTTYRQIRAQLTEGVGKGEAIPDIAHRVESVFHDANRRRATTIARTEVVSAFNSAQSDAARSLPADIVAGQEWISTGDARTRPEHLDADGQIVPITESFDVGGEALEYPGDPGGSASNVVNCRCTIAFLDPEEMDARYQGPGSDAEDPPTADESATEPLLTRARATRARRRLPGVPGPPARPHRDDQ